jgi:ornithine cyclodeaminase
MVSRLLPPEALLAAMVSAFVDPPQVPARVVVETEELGGQGRRTLLAMPAVRAGGLSLVKVVHVVSGAGAGLGSHLMAFDRLGTLLAVIEAHQLTARRTAAVSVLAAQTLGAAGARHLAVLGAGRQARAHIDAFAAAMPLDTLTIWARRAEAAAALAAHAHGMFNSVRVAVTPAEAVRCADLITCATASSDPLINGDMVAVGAHVDLIGGFRPTMREVDDTLIARAAVVIDTPAALAEAGDLLGPIATGALDATQIVLLADVLTGRAKVPAHEITVFKSVGHAGEDLVATELLLERMGLIGAPAAGSATRITEPAGASRNG